MSQAAIYIRCSTAEQARSGLGLEAQLTRCRAYITALGLDEGCDVRVFTDAGVSAGNLNRPALQELLTLVRRRQVHAVVVLKLDRLARRIRDMLELVDTLQRYGAALASVSERIDASSATGRLMLQLLGVFAEFERERIRERTREAAAVKRERGEVWGFEPLGARAVAGKLEVVADEMAAIDLMVRRRSEGASLRKIAAELAEQGFETKRGGQWRACTVANVLKRVERGKAAA